MSTVLPTPAPPKRPTLPPRVYGAIKSTTLIPVSKIFCVGSCCANVGASRWIGQYAAAFTGSSESIVLPSTLKMRPGVPSPTGTGIDVPLFCTTAPRAPHLVVPHLPHQFENECAPHPRRAEALNRAVEVRARPVRARGGAAAD